MIWIFMESEGGEIKSKQASKKDRTLPWLRHQNDYSGTLAQKCDTYLPKVGVEILILLNVPTIGTPIQNSRMLMPSQFWPNYFGVLVPTIGSFDQTVWWVGYFS